MAPSSSFISPFPFILSPLSFPPSLPPSLLRDLELGKKLLRRRHVRRSCDGADAGLHAREIRVRVQNVLEGPGRKGKKEGGRRMGEEGV